MGSNTKIKILISYLISCFKSWLFFFFKYKMKVIQKFKWKWKFKAETWNVLDPKRHVFKNVRISFWLVSVICVFSLLSSHSISIFDQYSDKIQFPQSFSACLWRRAWLSVFNFIHLSSGSRRWGLPTYSFSIIFSKSVFVITFLLVSLLLDLFFTDPLPILPH